MSKFVVKVGNKYVGRDEHGVAKLVATQKEAAKVGSRAEAVDLRHEYDDTRIKLEPRTVKLRAKDS